MSEPQTALDRLRDDADSFEFDVAITPFSTRGSWLNLSPVVGYHDVRDHIYLVSHRTRINPVLQFVIDEDREPGRWSATPHLLTWRGANGTVEVVFDTPCQLRLRVRGVALELRSVVPQSGMLFSTDAYIDQHTGGVVFTVEETGQRYRVTAEQSDALTPHGLYHGAYRGDASGPSVSTPRLQELELLIEEMEGISAPAASPGTFEQAVERQRRAVRDYAAAVAPFAARSGTARTIAHAAYINWTTTVSADGFLTRDAMLMSKHWMDKTWSWDHCFNALATARLADDAWDQFWIMFDHQTELGQIPDSVAHSERRYNYSKPPIHGLMLQALLARLLEQPSRARLEDSYRKLSAWTTWWRTAMTAPGEVLSHYYFGNDSGWDNSTAFDGFHPVQSPDLNAFLILQAEVLAGLARRLDDPVAADEWEGLAASLLQALLGQLWDGSRFVVRQPQTGQTRWSRTLLLTMPIVLGRRLPADVLQPLISSIEGHLTRHGLATEHPESAEYDSDGYWRGPIWAPSTYLIWTGLLDAGAQQLADRVRDGFLRLCQKGGFAENFDAVTGRGLRDRAYTWTSSVYLLLAESAEVQTLPVDQRG